MLFAEIIDDFALAQGLAQKIQDRRMHFVDIFKEQDRKRMVFDLANQQATCFQRPGRRSSLSISSAFSKIRQIDLAQFFHAAEKVLGDAGSHETLADSGRPQEQENPLRSHGIGSRFQFRQFDYPRYFLQGVDLIDRCSLQVIQQAAVMDLGIQPDDADRQPGDVGYTLINETLIKYFYLFQEALEQEISSSSIALSGNALVGMKRCAKV